MRKVVTVLLLSSLLLSGCESTQSAYERGLAEGQAMAEASYQEGYNKGYVVGLADTFGDNSEDTDAGVGGSPASTEGAFSLLGEIQNAATTEVAPVPTPTVAVPTYEDGKKAGYDEGYKKGYDAGKSSGYDAGVSAGYDDGYYDGLKKGKSSVVYAKAESGTKSNSSSSSSSSSGNSTSVSSNTTESSDKQTTSVKEDKPAVQEEVAPVEYCYVSSMNGYYHKSGCTTLPTIHESMTVANARSTGYSPCPLCCH